jgi:hypothetical protein
VTESDITAATASDTGQNGTNVLILQAAYYPDATTLAAATTTFDGVFNADGKALVIYASSSTTDARIAYATITDAGDISAATDVAVLVGMTVANAASYFAIGNFIL